MVVRGLKVLPRAKIFHVKKNLGEHFYNLGIGKDFFQMWYKRNNYKVTNLNYLI